MVEEFETITVNFEIKDNKLPVYIEGYVDINDEEAEDVDWYFWNGNGYSSQMKIHHKNEEITGLTEEQQQEIWAFEEHYLANDALWIDDTILQSNENENRTYVREFCTLIINDGAKMECELKETPEYGDYWVELIPKFNGERLNLARYIEEFGEEFDPWGNQLDDNCVENGHIYFEMSKNYFDDDEDDDVKESLMQDINEEASRIYARVLTYEMGIYAKYGDVMEQALDDTYDAEWLFKMSQHENDTPEEIDAFLRGEGFIDEELEY